MDHADAAPPVKTTVVKAAVKRGVLTVTGTAARDVIVLHLRAGDPTTLEVDVGGDSSADFGFARSTFTVIQVDGGGGADTLVADPSNGSFTDTQATTLDGGDGNDMLLGGNGAERLLGGPGDDFIDANQGMDVVGGGDGADTIQWDPGDSSDVVDGGAGPDRLVFNGANIGENFAVTADAGHVRFTRDIAAIALDLDNTEALQLRTLGGSDTVTVGDLTGTDLTDLTTDLTATGTSDGTADQVTVNGTTGDDHITVVDDGSAVVVGGLTTTVQVSGADTSLDHLVVAGLEGNDDITATAGAQALILLDLLQ
jgi:RTX calcium-binding nonapeptide repeat (4 copies)